MLVTDAVADLEDDITTALDAGISCVTWSDAPDLAEKYGESFAAAGRTLLTGANVGHGIAPCLAAHEAARSDEVLELMVAWTEPGRRLRRGVPVAFPDPVGALWGYEVASSGLFRAVTAPDRRHLVGGGDQGDRFHRRRPGGEGGRGGRPRRAPRGAGARRRRPDRRQLRLRGRPAR